MDCDKYCSGCIHYRWIEDLYDEGSYIEYEYCDLDCYYPCSYYNPACKYFCEIN